ncbi:MAG: AI-2E family transporter [Hyphomicrobiaceae bacterium]
MSSLAGFPPLGRSIIVIAAIAIILAFTKFSAGVVAPILLAIFISVVAVTPLRWMHRNGIPKWIALALIIFVLFDIGGIFALVATGTLDAFRDSLPGYQERIAALLRQLSSWLENSGMAQSSDALPDLFEPGTLIRLVRSSLANLSGTFGTVLVVLLAASFMLVEAQELETKFKSVVNLSRDAEQRLTSLFASLRSYMWIKTLMSLATAACVWVWLWVLGIDFAALWTILAFALNFIPFIGAAIMTVPPVLMAIVQTDPQTSLLVGLGIIAINFIVGSIVEPRIMGSGLGISPLAVFLSLIFWGWLLGPAGVFLSVPLTIASAIACEFNPQTRPVAILLGSGAAQDTAAGSEVNESN